MTLEKKRSDVPQISTASMSDDLQNDVKPRGSSDAPSGLGLAAQQRERLPSATERAESKLRSLAPDDTVKPLLAASVRARTATLRVVWLQRAASAWARPIEKVSACLGRVINWGVAFVDCKGQRSTQPMGRRYALRDDQWERIKDLLPGRAGHVGVTAHNNRLFVDAVLYRYRAGIAWRDLPERFGDFRVVHLRHMRWSKSGVWQRVFEALACEADNEYAMIDATIVRAHQHSAGAKGGRLRKPSDAAGAV
jgi:transposase